MYYYIHKDGRIGQSENGAWFAIKIALGEKEASDIINKSKSVIWSKSIKDCKIILNDQDPKISREAKLFVNDEQIGIFYK